MDKLKQFLQLSEDPKSGLKVIQLGLKSDRESEIVRLLRLQKSDGLKMVFEDYSDQLLNQCYRILLSQAQAEDAVQEILLKLPVSIQNFRGDSSLGTWLFRISHNYCLSMLSQEKNRYRLRLEQARENVLESDKQLSHEDADLLSRLLARLDEESRSLFWLKEGEGLSLKELSSIFEIPEGTIKSRLSRLRDKLQVWATELTFSEQSPVTDKALKKGT